MERKRVLVINIGWEQEPLIDKLLDQECELYGIHYDESAYRSSEFQDILVTDLRDLEKIINFADEVSPDVVISDQCDYSFFAQSVLCEKCGLPGPRIEQGQVSSSKLIQRRLAERKGILIPKFSEITQPDEIYDFLEKVNYPIILKPIDNRGSFGVTKVTNEQEILTAYMTALSHSHSRIILAEEFIQGIEMTIDGYCFQEKPVSLALARKGHVDDKRQVSVDIKYPGEIPERLYQKAMNLNAEVAKKLGYKFGMIHSEYILTPSGDIYLIESANRGGGAYTSEIIVPTVSGVNILEAYINDCFGKRLTSEPSVIKKNEVILKFFSFAPGKITAIHGVESAKRNPFLKKIRLAVQPGDVIGEISNDSNRHGFVIVNSKSQVREQAAEIIDSITVSYLSTEN